MRLSDAKIRTLKPSERAYKVSDGGGLYLHVKPSGSKLWRMKYRFRGKERLLAIGPYPSYSLKDARSARDQARELLDKDIDPSHAKQKARRARLVAAKNSFESVARAWHERRKAGWSKKHAAQVLRSLELDIFPEVGHRPISEIEAPEILFPLRQIESRGAHEIAARVRQRISATFRYGIAIGVCSRDPAADLSDALAVPAKRHLRALPANELGDFLKALNQYQGARYLVIGLQLLLLTATRSTELMGARWDELDIKERLWRIPADRMKGGVEHLVPLSAQALTLLGELHALTKHSAYLLPGRTYLDKPVSNTAFLMIVRRIGYQDKTTVHGLRSLFSTVANESGLWSPDAIERQLAHMPRDQVRAAYNRAQHMEERRRLLEWWAQFIEAAQRREKVTVMSKRA